MHGIVCLFGGISTVSPFIFLKLVDLQCSCAAEVKGALKELGVAVPSEATGLSVTCSRIGFSCGLQAS